MSVSNNLWQVTRCVSTILSTNRNGVTYLNNLEDDRKPCLQDGTAQARNGALSKGRSRIANPERKSATDNWTHIGRTITVLEIKPDPIESNCSSWIRAVTWGGREDGMACTGSHWSTIKAKKAEMRLSVRESVQNVFTSTMASEMTTLLGAMIACVPAVDEISEETAGS